LKEIKMSYAKHRAEVTNSLREFERVTGTGNMKSSNLAMVKIVKSLVAMMETMPTGCGGNCQCQPTPMTLPKSFAVAEPVEIVPEPTPEIDLPLAETVTLETAPIADEVEHAPVVEPSVEVSTETLDEPMTADATETADAVDEAPKPKKGKK
jgi:hypothetical protein